MHRIVSRSRQELHDAYEPHPPTNWNQFLICAVYNLQAACRPNQISDPPTWVHGEIINLLYGALVEGEPL